MIESQGFFHNLQKDSKGFLLLSEHLKKQCGISLPLNNKNQCLMASRLLKVMKDHSFESYRELFQQIHRGNKNLNREFIIALTTNTTDFFREEKHFSVLTHWIPKLQNLDQSSDEIRIWCAASSSGQEPYSIAMACEEYKQNYFTFSYRVLATDIDQAILTKALKAEYKPEEIKSIPIDFLKKYFSQFKENSFENRYKVKRYLSDSITFALFNHNNENYPFKKKFHCIFVRNVFIYFELDLIQTILNKMAECLYPGGILFLGHSESGTMKSPYFKVIDHSVYQRI